MPTSNNYVRLEGYAGHDPEIRRLETGKLLAKLNLATTDSWNDQNGQKMTKTEWHSVNFWGRQAELVEMSVKKGSYISVEGKLQYNTYEDKEGRKITRAVITARQFTNYSQFINQNQNA
jgi:single-strand DNA-binding protein